MNAYVRRDTVSAYLGSAFTPVRIMVPEEDTEQGQRLLDELVDRAPG